MHQAVNVLQVGGVDGHALEGGQLLRAVDAQRVVGGEARRSRVVGAAYLVRHDLVQRGLDVRGAGCDRRARVHQAAEVNHVGVTLAAVVAAVAVNLLDAARHGREGLLIGAGGVHLLREAIEVLDELVNLREVDHRQRDEALVATVDGGQVAVADGAAQVQAVGRGVLGQIVNDRLVLPAVAGLALLRGVHVVRVRGQDVGRLERAHQAGVEADEVKLLPHEGEGACERGVELAQGERVVAVALVKTDAGDGAAAVVPQNEAHVVSGVVLDAPL